MSDILPEDGFILHGIRPASETSRDVLVLVKHAGNGNRRYPGCPVVFNGTFFVPALDCDEAGGAIAPENWRTRICRFE